MDKWFIVLMLALLGACEADNAKRAADISAPRAPTAVKKVITCVDGVIKESSEGISPFVDCGSYCVAEGESCGLPPARYDCASDDDCVAYYDRYVNDEGSCCRGCGTAIANKDSAKTIEEACSKLGGEGCPEKKCVALSGPVVCLEGQCHLQVVD